MMINYLHFVFFLAISTQTILALEKTKLLFYGIGPTIEKFQSHELYQSSINNNCESYNLNEIEYGWTCFAYPFIEITRYFNPWIFIGNTSTSKGSGKEIHKTLQAYSIIENKKLSAESNSNSFFCEIGNGFQLYISKENNQEFIWYLLVGYNKEVGTSYTRIGDQTYYTKFQGKGINAGLFFWYSKEHSWSMFTGIDVIPNPFLIKTKNISLQTSETNATKINLIEIAYFASFFKEIQQNYHIGIGLFISGYKNLKPSSIKLTQLDQQAYKSASLRSLKGLVCGALLQFRQDF